MRKDDFSEAKMHCIVCMNEIPPERKSDLVTCSKECTARRKNFLRSKVDQKACRYCFSPSTPEERVRYQAWRRWEKAGQNDEKSAVSLLREVERLKRKLAEMAAQETTV